jgi:membrane-bound serine protease (ClpP class)
MGGVDPRISPPWYDRCDVMRLALGCLAAAAFLFGTGAATAQGEHVIEVVELEGVIDPSTAGYLEARIGSATTDGSDVVILQLDTPGGLDVSMRDMVQRIVRSPVPVVVWVGPSGARAASAGTTRWRRRW